MERVGESLRQQTPSFPLPRSSLGKVGLQAFLMNKLAHNETRCWLMELYPPTSSSSLGISSQLAKPPVLSCKPGSMFEQLSCMQSGSPGPHIFSSERLAHLQGLSLLLTGRLPQEAYPSLMGLRDCLLFPSALGLRSENGLWLSALLCAHWPHENLS